MRSRCFCPELRSLGRMRTQPARPLPVRTRTGGPGDTGECPAVAPEDTDFELSRGEKAERESTQNRGRNGLACHCERLAGASDATAFHPLDGSSCLAWSYPLSWQFHCGRPSAVRPKRVGEDLGEASVKTSNGYEERVATQPHYLNAGYCAS
jgi:hypothetical protein